MKRFLLIVGLVLTSAMRAECDAASCDTGACAVETQTCDAKTPCGQSCVAQQEQMQTQLIQAIARHDIDNVKKAIADGVCLNTPLTTTVGEIFPLQVAIMAGTPELIDLLCAHGAEFTDAIERAIRAQHTHFQRLVERAEETVASIKSKNVPTTQGCVEANRNDALGHEFVKAMQDPESLKQLIDSGADINVVFALGNLECTPLYFAFCSQNKAALDTLLQAGARLDIAITVESGIRKTVIEAMEEICEDFRARFTGSQERLAYVCNKQCAQAPVNPVCDVQSQVCA